MSNTERRQTKKIKVAKTGGVSGATFVLRKDENNISLAQTLGIKDMSQVPQEGIALSEDQAREVAGYVCDRLASYVQSAECIGAVTAAADGKAFRPGFVKLASRYEQNGSPRVGYACVDVTVAPLQMAPAVTSALYNHLEQRIPLLLRERRA